MSNSLKIKVLTVSLIILMIITLGTICFATEGAPAEETQEVEIQLNRKIFFTGETYWSSNGRRVRKEYKDGEIGCGIISIIQPRKEFGIYVTGEGWISEEQVLSSQKFIDIEFDTDDLEEEGLGMAITIDGEYTNVEVDNTTVVDYEDGKLEIKDNGKTTVTFITEEGEEKEVLTTVVDGKVVISVPEQEISTEIKGEVEIAEEIKVEAEGDAKAVLVIDEDGFDVKADGKTDVVIKADEKEIVRTDLKGDVTVKVDPEGAKVEGKTEGSLTIKSEEREIVRTDYKGEGKVEANPEGIAAEGKTEGKIILKVDEKEVVKTDIKGEGKVEVTPEEIKAEAKGNQTISILERFAIKFREGATARADKEKATVTAGGNASVSKDEEEKEIAAADTSLTYKYGEDDATVNVTVEALDKEVINKKEIKVIDTMRRLLEKMRAQ